MKYCKCQKWWITTGNVFPEHSKTTAYMKPQFRKKMPKTYVISIANSQCAGGVVVVARG